MADLVREGSLFVQCAHGRKVLVWIVRSSYLGLDEGHEHCLDHAVAWSDRVAVPMTYHSPPLRTSIRVVHDHRQLELGE